MENIIRFNKDTLVSIIIPCRSIDKDTLLCIEHCDKLPNNIEIIPVPDNICTGFPATKRNWAMSIAKGQVFAFLDSDAYPSQEWLNNALPLLNFAPAVCGPGVLPVGSSILEYATDLVYRFMPYSYRVVPNPRMFVDEFPTFNLIVRANKAPKFRLFLTGEDSLFCREIGEIFYDPSVLVYHKRRPLFKPYWKQISTFGWNRGYLVGLAFLGWLSTFFIYGGKFVCGFCTCLTNTLSRGREKK